jgi:ADP-ribose pyrophosphatase
MKAVSTREYHCAQCGFRHYVNPISAVAAILTNPRDEVLLIRRAIEPGLGKLGLPGGFVDPAETAEDAVRREVLEEVNLDLNGYQYFVSVPNRYRHQDIEWPVLDLFFTLCLPDFHDARAMDEVQELQTTPLADLDVESLAFPSLKEAMRQFRQTRAKG